MEPFLLDGILTIIPYFAIKAGLVSSLIAGIAIAISVASLFVVVTLKEQMANKSWIKGEWKWKDLALVLRWLVMGSSELQK